MNYVLVLVPYLLTLGLYFLKITIAAQCNEYSALGLHDFGNR